MKKLLINLLFISLLAASVWAQTDVGVSKLDDGVVLYRKKNAAGTPSLWQELVNLANVVIGGDAANLPFNKSIALLVGVSRYAHLRPQLPFAANNVDAMREYLLGVGGFDEVYVALDSIATPDLIKRYMLNRFRDLYHKDRLLFYYSGHGTDLGSDTGYMQFSGASNDDYVTDYLAISDCLQWGQIPDVRHILFIFDCCASCLAFSSDKYEDHCDNIEHEGNEKDFTASNKNRQGYDPLINKRSAL